jgi:hypothetical protein
MRFLVIVKLWLHRWQGSPVSNPVSCAWYIVTICLSGESCVTSTTKKNYKISHDSIHREIVSLRTYTMYNLTTKWKLPCIFDHPPEYFCHLSPWSSMRMVIYVVQWNPFCIIFQLAWQLWNLIGYSKLSHFGN